jgi:uncharacterized membrane protein YebE (DUF533 family)
LQLPAQSLVIAITRKEFSMSDPQRLLEQFLGGTATTPGKGPGGVSPDLLKGAAMGGIAGLLLGSKSGRKLTKSAVKLGGIAALGGLAWRAYKDWQATRQPGGEPRVVTPSPPAELARQADGTVFLPAQKSARDSLALTLMRAMIAAAKADGHLDADEQQRIFAKIDEFDLDSDDKAFLIDELRASLDIDAVVRSATSPESAAEIYTVSRLAIDPDHAAEKAYLAMLASRLALPEDLVARIDAEVEKVPA